MGMHRSKARQTMLRKRLAPATIARLQGNPSKAAMKKRTHPSLVRACAFIRLFHQKEAPTSMTAVPVVEISDTDGEGEERVLDVSLDSPSSHPEEEARILWGYEGYSDRASVYMNLKNVVTCPHSGCQC